jgi:alkylation response protein AidB-like acyl-CoA dehydrogenase
MAVDLSFTEPQVRLGESARDYFERRCPSTLVREIESGTVGYQPEMWREMAGHGWLGVTYPEAYGGGGGSFLDLYPLYEAMGRYLVPSPHLDTVALCGEVILAAGSEAQKQALLPGIAAGERILAAAVLEANGTWGPSGIRLRATEGDAGYVLHGTKLLVGFVDSADHLLCAVRTGDGRGADGISLILVAPSAPGLSHTPLQNVAGLPLSAVSFDGVAVGTDDVVGEIGAGWDALSTAATKAAVLQTATIVGAAGRVLEMANQYAKDREQFGRPIGSYQAVQYLVSDILIDMHRADLLARQAAYRIDAGKPFAREAAIAIAFGKEAAAHLHRQAHELHAGVAFMLSHDLTLYSRRSKYWETNLGDARYHREQLAVAIGL